MTLLNDTQITYLARHSAMITPFVGEQQAAHGLSYGLGPCGYDMRLEPRWLLADSAYRRVIQPGAFDGTAFIEYTGDTFTMPPHGFMLVCSLETFIMPDNVAGVCYDKSTLARCGIAVNTTILEPGWTGQLTIEVTNNSPWYIEVDARAGIAQVQFTLLAGGRPENTYRGKYNAQVGVTMARNGGVNA